MKKPIYILFLFVLLFPITEAFATAQVPDRIIYKGDTLKLFSNPLEYLPNIDELRPRLFGDKEGCKTTACWRGYEAIWIIIDDTLYLTGIFECCYGFEYARKADLKKLFGAKCKNGIVKADWFSGAMISPQGKLMCFVHMGYASTYERELEFYFKKGLLLGTKINDNSKNRDTEYGLNELKLYKFIYTTIRWDKLPKLNDVVVKVSLQFSANENGIIDSVKVINGYDIIFDREAIRTIKAIPAWGVFYRHGKFIRISQELSVVFSEANRKRFNQ